MVVTPAEHAELTYFPGTRKLTPEQVSEIRRRAAAGAMQTTLGDEFGVTKGAIWAIVHRKNWAREAA
jgi:hypothetical protein